MNESGNNLVFIHLIYLIFPFFGGGGCEFLFIMATLSGLELIMDSSRQSCEIDHMFECLDDECFQCS